MRWAVATPRPSGTHARIWSEDIIIYDELVVLVEVKNWHVTLCAPIDVSFSLAAMRAMVSKLVGRSQYSKDLGKLRKLTPKTQLQL